MAAPDPRALAAAVRKRDEAEAQVVELEKIAAEQQEQLAWLADRLAGLTAPAVAKVQPVAKAVARKLDPAAEARAREDTSLSASAILAREGKVQGSRAFWHGELERLGRHLAPDEPPTVAMQRALADPRGQDLLGAKQRVR
jgi:hypothetical protein